MIDEVEVQKGGIGVGIGVAEEAMTIEDEMIEIIDDRREQLGRKDTVHSHDRNLVHACGVYRTMILWHFWYFPHLLRFSCASHYVDSGPTSSGHGL